jgi:hypothetical protein
MNSYIEGVLADKRSRANEARDVPLGNIKQSIGSLQQKYSSLLGPKGEETPESLKTKFALNQALRQQDTVLSPQQKQGIAGKIGQKIGETLHLAKKPEAQSTTMQPVDVNTPAEGVTLAATPAYSAAASGPPQAASPTQASGATQPTTGKQPLRAKVEPGTEEATLPPMGAATPAPQFSRPTTVKGPALNAGQLKEQAQRNQRVQQQTDLLTAAAPPTAQEQAVQTARAQGAGNIESIRAGLEAIKLFHPKATPEALELLNNDYLDTALGTKEKPGAESFKPQALTLEDGSTVTAQYDTKSGRWFYLDGNPVPGDVLRAAKIAGKPATPRTAWSRDEKDRIFSVKLDPVTNQEMPSTRNYSLVPPASLTGRISTGQFHYVDEDGQVHEVAETRTSAPMRGGGGPSPAAPSGAPGGAGAAPPAGAGSAPRPTRAPAAPSASRGTGAGRNRVIGWKGTKEYSDLRTQYHGALSRKETMDKNLEHALQGDQQAMLSLVANHIGMTLGAQKGARINQAVWNEAVASAPWIEASASKWFHREPTSGDLIFDGYKSGVTLTPDQMRSMVQLAHEQVDTLKESLDRVKEEQQPSQGGAPAGPAGSGGKSLADRLSDALGGK